MVAVLGMTNVLEMIINGMTTAKRMLTVLGKATILRMVMVYILGRVTFLGMVNILAMVGSGN